MKQILVVCLLSLFSISAAYSRSESIVSTCFFGCKTTVKVNGVKRVFEGVKTAEFLKGTNYLILDGDTFASWPDGEFLNLEKLGDECPTCLDAYISKQSLSPDIKNFCDDNFIGSFTTDDCEKVITKDIDLDQAQEILNVCENIYWDEDSSLVCLTDVIKGDQSLERLNQCAEKNTFVFDKRNCVEESNQ